MTTHESDILETLRSGKRELRRERIAMSLPEKVRQVVELQKIHVAIIGQRRALSPIERVWELEKR